MDGGAGRRGPGPYRLRSGATHGHGVRAELLRPGRVVLLAAGTIEESEFGGFLPRHRASLAWVVAIVVGLAWSDWPAIRTMFDRWMNDPRYSHGLLVPVFALYLLWRRRGLCPEPLGRPSLWGLSLLGVGASTQVFGSMVFLGWFEGLALILVLGGVAMLWGGPKALRWVAPSLAFLLFMIPLPYRVEVALGGPLQTLGTVASTYALQTIGLAAISEGNIIRLDDRASIAVVEACNGLGMLAAFACYATAAAMIMERRHPVIRVVVLLSSIPLSLIANVTRITATGLVHSTIGGGAADLIFHDLAGWLMMPLALGLLWGELAVLGALLVEKNADESIASVLKQSMAGHTARGA